jgi:hypothetical protein
MTVFFDTVHLMIHFPSFVESEKEGIQYGSFCVQNGTAGAWCVARHCSSFTTPQVRWQFKNGIDYKIRQVAGSIPDGVTGIFQ